MVRKKYIPAAGDIVWIDFSPTKGHEQAKLRPALVLSAEVYNKKTSMAVMCPITSQIKSYPFEVVLKHKKITGAVLVDQIRSLDWQERRVTYCAKAPDSVRMEVQEKLSALLFA
jgi:mRNA interferase MazF